MSQLTLVDHPVLQRALTLLRRRETPQRVFREELQRASLLLAVEAARGISTATIRIETPLEPTEGMFRNIDASITARPFFEARGFQVVAAQSVVRRGQRLTNFRMEKFIGASDH